MSTEQIDLQDIEQIDAKTESLSKLVAGPSRLSQGLQRIASSQLLMWATLVVLFALFPLLLLKGGSLTDPDIWWHMRAGEWILQHHHFLRTDPFSATTMGHPWVDYSWLFEFVFNLMVSHFDLVSILWFQVAIMIAITAALLKLVIGLMPRFWAAIGLTTLAFLGVVQNLPPQPMVFTILFFILEFHLLLSAERTGRPKRLWAIPFLFVLWANIHIEFVSGLFLLGVFCVEPALEKLFRVSDGSLRPRLPNRQLWLVLGASVLGTLANPYGTGLYRTVLNYARDTKVYDVIAELKAMDFRNPMDWAVLALLMAGCFFLGRARQVRIVWVVLMIWAAWMSFRSEKEVWLVAVIATGLIASQQTWNAPASVKINRQLRVATAFTVFFVLVAAAGRWHVNSHKLLAGVNANYPTGAVSYIREHHLQGPLLNEFSWGGFLIYALPEIPVSMDGRTNVHSQDDVLKYLSLFVAEPGWAAQPELRNANLVICNHSFPLGDLLARDSRFRVVYDDRVSVLLERVDPAKDDVKDKTGK